MLVISRRPQETVELDGEIRVTVLEIRPDQVKLGVQAPRQIGVYRSELRDRVRQANQASATLSPDDLPLAGSQNQFAPPTVHLSWPVSRLERSLPFYQSLGFEIRSQRADRCQLQRLGIRLELIQGEVVGPLSLGLSSAPTRWQTDPDGYTIGC